MGILDNFSTREKNLWSELLVDAAAGLYYYPKAFSLIHQGVAELTAAAMASLVTNTVIVAIFAGVIVSIFLHTQKKPEQVDERDLLFRARGNTIGYYTLVACIILVMGHVITNEMMPSMSGFELTPVLLANALLVSLFISSVAKTVSQLYCYRRGY